MFWQLAAILGGYTFLVSYSRTKSTEMLGTTIKCVTVLFT
jgi:hypothetical protein